MPQSLRFPLPFNIHLTFVIISVILLMLCYKKKKHLYELLMLIGVASTMLVYITDTRPLFYILGLEEIILFVMTAVDMYKVSKAENAATDVKADIEINEDKESLASSGESEAEGTELSEESIPEEKEDSE